ncbi:MAG: lytic transglycosylase domain-containing protein [Sphingobium sp.]|uniref:lytic transglycosylase domain-containing protein n=1 Tax=Sphingobium sp. TaxID=1912891 RepID=UPI0029A717A2|nr:lytic transglycosylase domain-containing protein [Sphingobium sp.]MDX3908500.1 lytic transglycosylase domain-containing protein [Sphingobium sp.]
MIRASFASLFLAGAVAASMPAYAAPDVTLPVDPLAALAMAPTPTGNARYQYIFAALDEQRWADAKAQIATLEEGDALRPFALAELYLAKNSPRVELFELLDLINKAPWLPQADQLSRLAERRGAQILPALPQVQKLVWLGASPRREYVATVKTDLAAQALGTKVIPLIKADNPTGAEFEMTAVEATLTPEGRTEWRQRIAWSYYIGNDDTNARRLAAVALTDNVGGDWAVQAHWTIGLAAWRQSDCRAAAQAFSNVAGLARNVDMRAAGAYWAARSYMNCGEPAKVAGLLKVAAKAQETFYGMLARESLGLNATIPVAMTARVPGDVPSILKDVPNVKAAMLFSAIGRPGKADEALRYQARLGGSAQYDDLLKVAGTLSLPATQLWLAHNGPAGYQPATFARFPAPDWKPDGGWRVDPSLVFAHTLQESGFRADAVSSAGAYGLMQVRAGTAGDVAGAIVSTAQLHTPSINMEYGQRYLERLRDMPATGGLLPKVMAAYNAGPTPVERWNYQVKDGGDPLLFMESLPYYETRAYVNIVMRNYWVYQLQAKGTADCLTGMAQGLWPRFPGTKGTTLVRLSAGGKVASAN